LHPMGDSGQGIVHVIGPQLGITQPGMTIVCGDSHTSTHGAFGALAFGAGTTAKDLVLALIAQEGTGGGQGYVVEYRGEAIRALSMEGRMTVCNMSIEWGARAGMIAPDATTYAYLQGRPHAPKGPEWERALDDWRSLLTDDDAVFD